CGRAQDPPPRRLIDLLRGLRSAASHPTLTRVAQCATPGSEVAHCATPRAPSDRRARHRPRPGLSCRSAMGEHDLPQSAADEQRMQKFTCALLQDVRALEAMLERGMFETGVRRIGAEQEMFLIDDAGRPKRMALPVLERLADPAFTTEL